MDTLTIMDGMNGMDGALHGASAFCPPERAGAMVGETGGAAGHSGSLSAETWEILEYYRQSTGAPTIDMAIQALWEESQNFSAWRGELKRLWRDMQYQPMEDDRE
jgi:hypothetical protein